MNKTSLGLDGENKEKERELGDVRKMKMLSLRFPQVSSYSQHFNFLSRLQRNVPFSFSLHFPAYLTAHNMTSCFLLLFYHARISKKNLLMTKEARLKEKTLEAPFGW